MSSLVSGWNKSISLRAPTVADLLSSLGDPSVTPVFKNGPQVQFYVGHNLVYFIDPLSKNSGKVKVTSVGAIMQADLYPGNTLAVPERVPSLNVAGITFPMSADDMLSYLSEMDPGRVQVQRTGDRFEMLYGKATSFLFLANSPFAEPENSRLGLIRFFYTMPFEGKIRPEMQSV